MGSVSLAPLLASSAAAAPTNYTLATNVEPADFDAALAITTRKRLLDRLATDRTPIIGYHLPFPGIGRVARKGSAYAFVAGRE